MKLLRRLATAGVAVIFSLSLAACGGDEPAPARATDTPGDAAGAPSDLVEAARKEGTVVYYSGSTEGGLKALAEAFHEKYGIEVKYVRLVTATIAQRFQAEVAAGKVETDGLLTVDADFFRAQAQDGNLVQLTPEEVPALADWPSDYMLDKAAAIVSVGTYQIGYNTELVQGKEPKTWQDLLAPVFAKKILLTDPRKSAAYAQIWSTVLNDPTLGPDFIEKFAAQGYRQIVDSAVPGSQLLGAGEGNILVAGTMSVFDQMIEQRAPVKYFTLQNPAPTREIYHAIPANAPHPNAARLFLNWLLSAEGQQVLNAAEKTASPLGPMEGADTIPQGVVKPDSAKARADLPEVLRLLGLE